MSTTIDSGGNVSELALAHNNCCLARMLPGEAEFVSEWAGLSERAKSVQRFERSNGLDTALYKNNLYNIYFVDINECLSQPCPDELLCIDEVNGYSCTDMREYNAGVPVLYTMETHVHAPRTCLAIAHAHAYISNQTRQWKHIICTFVRTSPQTQARSRSLM